MIRVLVADSTPMASELLASALRRSRSPKFEVAVPRCLTPDACLEHLMHARPDVAILALMLSNEPTSGLEVVRRAHAHASTVKSIILLEQADLVLEAFRAGADGVFPRFYSPQMLARCIESVHAGQIWASAQDQHYLVEELRNSKPVRIIDAKGHSLLSLREAQVVRLVAEGLSNREISKELSLSEHTVKNYLFRIFEKLGVGTRVELVLYSIAQRDQQETARHHNAASVL